MSNTSNRWKSQGGINRRAMNNILSNNKQATNTLTIPQQLGISNTTLEQYGDKRDMDNSALYKMTEGEQSYDTIIAYYPFNNLGESGTQMNNAAADMISNKTFNKNITSVNKEGNFNLSCEYPNNGEDSQINPYVSYVPIYGQTAIQFRNNSKLLISRQSLNTLNSFSQTENTESISSVLTFETFLFIPTGTENFCIFALDDLVQSGLYQNPSSDDESSPDCFYLWYKGGETYGNTLQTYYSHNNSDNVTEIKEDNCGEIVPDTWHKITVVFGGSYIALYIDGKQTFQHVISNGSYSYIPDKPITFNLGPLIEPFSNGPVTSSNDNGFGSNNLTTDMTTYYKYLITSDGTGPMLLDAKVSLKANTKEFIEYMYNPGNGHQYASSRVPNSDEKRLLYLLSGEMVGFNAPVTCENDVAIAGKLSSFGETNIYAQSNFHDITRFYSDVIFESSMTKIVYDSSAIGHLEILSNQDSTNTSILVQNDSNNNNMPSMLVYNTENPITEISETENLIFSISGENVSIGEIYGQHTFDVKGDSSFLGKVGIGKPNPETTLDVEGQITSSGKISGNGGIHSGSNNASGFFVNSNDTQELSYDDIKDARGYIGTNYSNGQKELDFHSINTNNNTDQPGGFRFYGHTHDSLKGDLYCNINSTGMHLNGKFTVEGEMEISDNVTLKDGLNVDGSLQVTGVATFQDITSGKTPDKDASGLEFPTCEWINSYIQADGGWITESIDNGINGIYNSNIDKENGYVGIGTKTPEYTLDVCGDIHMISGDLILEEGDISMNGSIVSSGSITTHTDMIVKQNITVDESANIGGDIDIAGKVGIGGARIDPNFVLDISGDMYSNGNILTLGKIGIGERGTNQLGKNEPQATLDVGGTMRVSEQVNFDGPVFGKLPTLTINEPSGGLQLVTMKWVLDTIGNDGGWITSGNSIYNGNIGNTNAFVGIGTMTPQSTLDVSGNTTLRGTLDISGESIFHSDMDISQNKISVQDISAQDISASRNLNINGAITFSDNISIQSNEVSGSIAMGNSAGEANQSANSIAMGNGAGKTGQGPESIAIGTGAGETGQGSKSIAIGYYAGSQSQATNSIAIGNNVNVLVENEIRIGATSNNVVIPGTSSLNQGIICGDGGKGTGIFVGSNDGQNGVEDNNGVPTNTRITFKEINKTPCYIGCNYAAGTNEVDFHSVPKYYTHDTSNINFEGGFHFYHWKSFTSAESSSNVDDDSYSPLELCRINTDGMVLSGALSGVTDITASGTITAETFNATSDLRLKENIHDLTDSLEKICAIRGVEYNWKADEEKKLHSGVIAQEVKESIPEAVNTDNEEQYSVNYNAIIGHLIEAVKTLKQEVDDLKGQLKK